jgi:hypothetical protein
MKIKTLRRLPNGDSEKVLHPSKRERADHGLCLEYLVTTDLTPSFRRGHEYYALLAETQTAKYTALFRADWMLDDFGQWDAEMTVWVGVRNTVGGPGREIQATVAARGARLSNVKRTLAHRALLQALILCEEIIAQQERERRSM